MTREIQAINAISSKLEKFSWVSSEKSVFRCALCGDSKKDPSLTRGTIMKRGMFWWYGCFNCNASMSFSSFLREFDEQAYKEFRLGRLVEDVSFNIVKREKSHVTESEVHQIEDVNSLFGGFFTKLNSLDKLPQSHRARLYWSSRKLPNNQLGRFYYTDDFNKWAMTVDPRQDLSKTVGEGIVIPLVDLDKNEFGFQCRFFEGKLRYKTIIVDDSKIKCFGMDKIDPTKRINVFEGVFDSIYLRNSIAALDSALWKRCDQLSERHGIPKENFALFYDFEKFNNDIIEQKMEAIEAGYSVAFVDRKLVTHKDVNAICQNSSNPKQTLKNLFSSVKILSGIRAKAEMTLNSRTL
ncbi:DNA primase protein [Rhizobium phage RHph_N34]|uniref:DNA primase protein n=1 Tax=Rhizobium phage RHph_N34 TaxID=2509586 RepID=A0A7S5UYT5_9CAUD|nr:DNA primase protein [Rhizobium phage RHph_N34]QIG73881.1 DNA primase protein [Rhizobium phage RHph_N34]